MDGKQETLFKGLAAYLPECIVLEYTLALGQSRKRSGFRSGSLLFADISGFTAMSERLSAFGREGSEEITRILNAYFTQMLGIAASYGGVQLKFGGDAMLVLFEGQGHEAGSVRCAWNMQAAMGKYRRLQTSRGPFELRMSIGINSGEFFAMAAGSPEGQMTFVFTGATVNRTAEVESSSGPGKVVVGDSTLKGLGKVVSSRPLGNGIHLIEAVHVRAAHASHTSWRGLGQIDFDQVSRSLAPFFADQLLERLKAQIEGARTHGELRRVATVFINFTGSSDVVEQGDRSEIEQVLDSYFNLVHRAVGKYGGTVLGCDLSNRGDKILAAFGAPVVHEDDDERAVLFAHELRDLLVSSGLPLKQRVGVNTGHVFSGDVGAPWRKEYTVIGDSVNLAARLMAAASDGEILVGQDTRARLGSHFTWEERPPIKVKGKSNPVPISALRAVGASTTMPRRLSSRSLIGREKELAQLVRAVDLAQVSRGQVVSLSGPAGIGKSRLVQELRRTWTERSGLLLEGACQSYGAGMPYHPFIQLLGTFFGFEQAEPQQARVSKLAGVVNALAPDLAEWAPLVGNILGLNMPEGDVLSSLDGKLRHQRLLDVALQLLLARASRDKLCLVIEDFHWADTSSIGLLNYLAKNIERSAVLICAAYRLEDRVALELAGQENHVDLTLRELPAEATLGLVSSLTGIREVPPDLGDLIVQRSQGNPLYAEEVIHSAIQSGHLVPDGEGYKLKGDVRGLQVPNTVEGVIMARLDRLDEETREMIRVASVIGRTFQMRMLQSLYPIGQDRASFVRKLDSLLMTGLITRGEHEEELLFQHVLTQEVAYQSLLFSRRRELHHAVGAHIEASHTDDRNAYLELLFFHYERSQNTWKTLEYGLAAADKVKKMWANQAAIGYYERALEAARKLGRGVGPIAAKAREDVAELYELVGRFDDALKSYTLCRQWLQAARGGAGDGQWERLLAICPSAIKPNRRQERVPVIYRKIAMVHERKGEYAVALRWLRNGMVRINDGGTEQARMNIASAGVLYRCGQYSQAMGLCRLGLEQAQAQNDLDETAHAYYLLGTIYTDTGVIGKAIEHRLKSLDIYEKMGFLPGQAKVHNNLGVDFYYRGDWTSSLDHYGKSLAIRKRMGDVNGMATVANNLGEVLSDQGRTEEAIAAFDECLVTWRRAGYQLGVGLALSNLGRAKVRKGQWSDAIKDLTQSVETFSKLNSEGFLADAQERLAEAYLEGGQHEAAAKACMAALLLARKRGLRLVQGVALRTIGKLQMCSGDARAAERSFRLSIQVLASLGASFERAITTLELRGLGKESDDGAIRGARQELGQLGVKPQSVQSRPGQ